MRVVSPSHFIFFREGKTKSLKQEGIEMVDDVPEFEELWDEEELEEEKLENL